MKPQGFEITGVEGVKELLDEIAPRHARNLMRATIQGIASNIAKDARKSAPKDTGSLRKAIKAKRKKSHPDNPISEVIVEHGSNATHDAFYWRFVEYGTAGPTGQSERPFIRPAADAARSSMPLVLAEEFSKKLESLLKREAKKRAGSK